MVDAREVYRVSDVAKLLDVTPWTIRQWITQGKLQAYKIGREWRVRYEEVHRLLGRPPDVHDPITDVNRQLESDRTD